jgi:hypothetical protein
MNPIEIEQAISELAERPFAPNSSRSPSLKPSTTGNNHQAARKGGPTSRISAGSFRPITYRHLPFGEVTKTLAALKASPATAEAKAKFILATDGETVEAEDLTSDDPPVICS